MSKRNNAKRASTPSANNVTMPPQMAATSAYQAPTEFVKIPSGGRFYPPEHPFHNAEEVEIKLMTAKEEDILASKSLLAKGIMIDRFIESVLIDKSVRADSLLAGDRNAIMLVARNTGYGSDYLTKVTCPSCSKVSEYTFDLSEYEIVNPEDVSQYGLHQTERGTFTYEAKMSKAILEVKLLDGDAEKFLTRLSQSKVANNLPESALTDFLKMIIVSVNGDANRATVESYVDNMPALDSKKLRTAYNKINPSIDLSKDFHCPMCNTVTQLEVPLSADFFWPKL